MAQKLYKVKLQSGHSAKKDQMNKDGYLSMNGVHPIEYTRGEAIKKANSFGGKIEIHREVKYFFVKLQEINGEYEYTHNITTLRNTPIEDSKVGDDLASTFYPDLEKRDRGYIGAGGCPFISVLSVQEITLNEYEILKKYI